MSVVFQEGRLKGERNSGKAFLTFKILIHPSFFQNAAASYTELLCHRPAVSHSSPSLPLIFQPIYTRTRMENCRKEKSILVGSRIHVLERDKPGSKITLAIKPENPQPQHPRQNLLCLLRDVAVLRGSLERLAQVLLPFLR